MSAAWRQPGTEEANGLRAECAGPRCFGLDHEKEGLGGHAEGRRSVPGEVEMAEPD
jgi:hypothetical protein